MIRELSAQDIDALREPLVDLLRDAVASGASIGFLPPVSAEEAADYWKTVADAVQDGTRIFLAAFDDSGQLTGSVQLDLATRANGLHRAEVIKLMVHTRARRGGVGRALMAAVEESATRRSRMLLVLDTRAGDPSERLYASIGYIRVGEIPCYAKSASGELHTTVIFYKLFRAHS